MSPAYKRWYDHDPLLLEVIELLKNYQTELRAQAEVFLQKIEEKVSKETIDKFYAMVKPVNANNRWYDKDPVISKTCSVSPSCKEIKVREFLVILQPQLQQNPKLCLALKFKIPRSASNL